MIGQTTRLQTESRPRMKTDGLTNAEADESRIQNGTNELTKRPHKSFFRRLLENFGDPIIRILLGAMVLNILLSLRDVNWPETIGIAVAVLTATLVSTISEAGSERAFEKLSSDDNGKVYKVRRDGIPSDTPLGRIVKNDVVLLTPGMMIPADGLVLSGRLKVDQSALTGEGEAVDKAPCGTSYGEKTPGNPHFVFRGALITEGEGEMLVTDVGDSTFYGKIAAELQSEELPSPLKERLRVLAGNVSKIGYVAAALVAVAYLLKGFVLDAGFDTVGMLSRLKDVRYVASELLGALTIAVSVIVVAVPEGLPMMITVILSSNMKKMLRSGVLVRRLVGIETAGSMNILFTDKTGTLTTGKMQITSIITGDGIFPDAERLKESAAVSDLMKNCALLCRSEGNNPTEDAFRRFYSAGAKTSAEVIGKLPFDSSRRLAAVRYRSGGKTVTVFRTSPEKLFQCADFFVASDGRKMPLTTDVLSRLHGEWQNAAADACRVVGVGCCDAGIDEIRNGKLHGVSLVALVRIRDEIRREAPAAVREGQSAGIQVVMITGDNEITAEAIAKRCGIIRSRTQLVLTGEKLGEMSDAEITEILPRLAVVARTVPADKSRLVRLSRKNGLVVGMTGDGINDAPALKAADVGFAMGSGTDVAKEAGDIIITDDNFASIIKAVLYGRTIFSSIRKFILFQLIMNLSAVAVSLIGPFIGVEQPVTVIQMLWVNMIMDTLGGLAFAGEPAVRNVMKKKPIGRKEPILTTKMAVRVTATASYSVLLSLFFLKAPCIREIFPGNETHMLTGFFAFFVFCGIFNSFNARTERLNPFANLTKNKPFLLIMTAVAAIQLALIYFGGETFRTVPLSPRELALTALFASSVIPADAVLRLLQRLFEKEETRIDKREVPAL